MALPEIENSLVEAGKKVLHAADDAGMKPSGAAWIYNYDLRDWRFHLVTPLVDKPGRFPTYRLLLKILDKLSLPNALTIFDIHLSSPNELLFKTLVQNMPFDFDEKDIKVTIHASRVNGIPIEAAIYRMLPSRDSDTRKVELKFRRRVRELAA